MKQFALVQVGAPGFRSVSLPYDAKEISSIAVQKDVERMKYTMRKVHGVGLAAPQVGIQKQLFVMRLTPTKFRPDIPKVKPYAVFNPQILDYGINIESDWEGCFSVAKADIFAEVKRPTSIEVSYLNEQAQTVERNLTGLEARIFQHEYDHLFGKVFLEKDVDLSTIMGANEYRKMRLEQTNDN